MSDTMSSDSSTLVCRLRRAPCRRSVGGRPTVRCRSEAPSLMTVSSRRSIWIVDIGNPGQGSRAGGGTDGPCMASHGVGGVLHLGHAGDFVGGGDAAQNLDFPVAHER